MTFKGLHCSCHKIKTSFQRCFHSRLNHQQEKPLSAQRQGGPLRICRIEGDRGLCAKMAAMGLYPGSEAELIHPVCGGQCLLKIEGGTLCLDKSASEGILVTSAVNDAE
ncbi:MAG TPA: hypothetical protein DEB25_02505 [Desulfobulbaceae bacterium]|nr:hypothetical protein [Desulfobulbaceae bacterium]